MCKELLKRPEQSVHTVSSSSLISDKKITLEIEDRLKEYTDFNDNEVSKVSNGKMGLIEILQIGSEIVNDNIPGVAELSKFLGYVSSGELKSFKNKYIHSRYLDAVGDKILFNKLMDLYTKEESVAYYYANLLDYSKNRFDVYALLEHRKIYKRLCKAYNDWDADDIFACRRDAAIVMQSNLFSFKVWCDFTLELDSRVFLDIFLFEDNYLAHNREFSHQITTFRVKDIMEWWLKSFYILRRYVKLEYRSNRIIFGVILRKYVESAKNENSSKYFKLDLKDIDILLCNWLRLDDNFWDDINLDDYLI